MRASDVDPAPPPEAPAPEYRRSVGALERDGRGWACELIAFAHGDVWRGGFAFLPTDPKPGEDELRTATIFVEDSQAEIHAKARSMGRPLLEALLDSALHVRAQERASSPFLQRWFRKVLSDPELGGGDGIDGAEPRADLDELRSLYASYRMDQVAHFIALVEPDDFHRAVDEILDGQRIDFAARDRLQLAMIVVEYIESRLPLPPFETWIVDFLGHRDRYQDYAHELHREGVLP
ncbi:MAG: hypothetical protein KJP18_06460 [Gemmatimonadetes bacterium]|nr:hypothetical protein [Gemmatimonadota bacterium]NNF38322.1 hypothetical protein [Gemmatimonadota bacterium]NNK64499.1 hypothetical protein [Gemmatimonadota bacterium]